MESRRNSILVSIAAFVLIVTITIGTISAVPMGESWEEKEGKVLNQKSHEVPASSEERSSGEDIQQTNQIDKEPPSTNPAQKICAARYDVCRSFGPKPLPCCEGYVCKFTYGEQHCVEPWFKIN